MEISNQPKKNEPYAGAGSWDGVGDVSQLHNELDALHARLQELRDADVNVKAETSVFESQTAVLEQIIGVINKVIPLIPKPVPGLADVMSKASTVLNLLK